MSYINQLKKIVIKYFPDEYFCHVYFVYKIALELQREYGGNKRVILAAALLHDIGRNHSSGLPHQIVGSQIAESELKKLNWRPDFIQAVKQCIGSHNFKTSIPKNLEEKIIASADGAAKVIYAPLFSLLCKKKPQDKPAWVLQYIEKGYQNICLSDFKVKIKPLYQQMKRLYQTIIQEKEKLWRS